MDNPGSISIWINQLKTGDSAALGPLWERYFARLVGLVRGRLRDRPRQIADEEDVALGAFDSLYRGLEEGRFPRLEDRDDLWQVLLMLARQKAVDLLRRESRQKRGGDVRPLSTLTEGNDSSSPDAFAELIGDEPSPDFAAEVAEECRQLLDKLGTGTLRAMAVSKMEGYSNEEMAAKFGCSIATVERKLKRIRHLWSRESEL